MSSEANVAKAGLEGVVAAQSSISDVNGQEGRLIYWGYDIHDLAEHATFEEVTYLLWNGKLPTSAQLEELKSQLSREARLPAEIQQLMRSIPKGAPPMDMLRTVVSALSVTYLSLVTWAPVNSNGAFVVGFVTAVLRVNGARPVPDTV